MQQPGATAPQTGSQPRVTQQTGQAMGTFITQEDRNTWRASKIVGVNIYGSNNETIGDVNEVLIDRSGQVRGVVIGVGGFLGIGEKYVAVPFNQVEWMLTDTRASANQNQTGAAMNSDAAESDRDGRRLPAEPRTKPPERWRERPWGHPVRHLAVIRTTVCCA
jgi:sporulation protein YlmC with PRC-barrel domain